MSLLNLSHYTGPANLSEPMTRTSWTCTCSKWSYYKVQPTSSCPPTTSQLPLICVIRDITVVVKKLLKIQLVTKDSYETLAKRLLQLYCTSSVATIQHERTMVYFSQMPIDNMAGFPKSGHKILLNHYHIRKIRSQTR